MRQYGVSDADVAASAKRMWVLGRVVVIAFSISRVSLDADEVERKVRSTISGAMHVAKRETPQELSQNDSMSNDMESAYVWSPSARQPESAAAARKTPAIP